MQIGPNGVFGPILPSIDADNLGDYRDVPASLPDSAIQPNPWPNLKSLSIWSMPATKKDVIRLVKTVAGTLRHLDMRLIRLGDKKKNWANSLPNGASGNGATTPSTGSINDIQKTHTAKLAEQDEWYTTIETISDVLRLESCTIIFSKNDRKRLEAKLELQVENFTESGVNINRVVSQYILKGEGMGLSLFAAEKIKELAKKTREAKDRVAKACDRATLMAPLLYLAAEESLMGLSLDPEVDGEGESTKHMTDDSGVWVDVEDGDDDADDAANDQAESNREESTVGEGR